MPDFHFRQLETEAQGYYDMRDRILAGMPLLAQADNGDTASEN